MTNTNLWRWTALALYRFHMCAMYVARRLIITHFSSNLPSQVISHIQFKTGKKVTQPNVLPHVSVWTVQCACFCNLYLFVYIYIVASFLLKLGKVHLLWALRLSSDKTMVNGSGKHAIIIVMVCGVLKTKNELAGHLFYRSVWIVHVVCTYQHIQTILLNKRQCVCEVKHDNEIV